MQEQKQEKKKFQKWPIVVLVLLIVLVIGSTFAWFTLQLTGTKTNTIKAGSLNMVLDDEASDGILLINAIPMSYQQGVATTEYTFTLKNNGSKSDYTISLKDEATYTNANDEQVTIESDKRIADTKIRYILLKDGEVAEASKSMLLSEATNRVIDSGTIANGTTITYSLRIWIDSKAENEVMGQIFNARLQLDATQHQEQEVAATTLCKRATTLHTETCSQTSPNGCIGDEYASGDTITYGSLGTSGTLTSGDAFDCDVNEDGTYDETTERFYYVADMNEVVTVLIYYNSVSGGEGESSNSVSYAYDISGTNNNGPVTAKLQLPTTTQWSNVSLTNTTRAITNETGGTTTGAGDLPTAFSYEGYAARLLTTQEVETSCNITVGSYTTGELSSKCKFLLENTKYSNDLLHTGYWLETPRSLDDISVFVINGRSRFVGIPWANGTSGCGVRPAIEVPKSRIEY